jgi:DNA-binding transcriptional ArsR family regulator
VVDSESELFEQARDWLRARLPTWTIELSQQVTAGGETLDGVLNMQAPQGGGAATLFLEARQRIEPRDAEQLMSGLLRRMRNVTNYQILVVSRWLSPQTRRVLTKNNLNYLDLTGNARIELSFPTVVIEKDGAPKDPDPLPKGRVRLQGPKAGRIIRTLADYYPPYGVKQLAEATDLAPSYVSRALDALDNEAVIERSSRGGVESVDVPALLRRWATTYEVLKSNRRYSFLAPPGPSLALGALSESSSRYAVTGSFAAYRIAAVTVPTLLMAYVDEPINIAQDLGWLPTDQGANVILLQAFDPVVWRGTHTEKNVTYAADSQVAVDCLTGNGRMPQEGEALLEQMSLRPQVWRKFELEPWLET